MLQLRYWAWLLCAPALAAATPVVTLGTPASYCVVFCYMRVPFTISGLATPPKIGRVLCEVDAEVTARLPVYNGEPRSKDLHASPIGVFRSNADSVSGDVEIDTGIRKEYFVGARLKAATCHM